MNIKNLQFLKTPHLTEKTSMLTEKYNQYVFKVSLESNKLGIKKAVEDYFSVKVNEVRVLKMKGKTRRDRKSNQIRKKSDWKKAYVTLAEGESIDIEVGTD